MSYNIITYFSSSEHNIYTLFYIPFLLYVIKKIYFTEETLYYRITFWSFGVEEICGSTTAYYEQYQQYCMQ